MSFLSLLVFCAASSAGALKALDLSVSTTAPSAGLLIGSSADVPVATFEISELRGRPTTVTKITVLNCLIGGDDGDCTDAGDVWGDDQAANSITVSYVDSAGATAFQTSYFASGVATFTGLDLWVPRRGTAEVEVLVETATVGRTGVASGAQFAAVIKAFSPIDFAATAPRSVPLTGRNVRAAAEGEIMTVVETKPTLSLSSGSPSGATIPGWNEVLRFDIAADSHGDIPIEGLLFAVVTTDNAGSGWNGLANLGQDTKWSLYNTVDLSTPIEIDLDFFGSSTLEYVLVSIDEEIPAGATSTFSLYADTTGASARDDDEMSIDIPDQTEADLLGPDSITWVDGSSGVSYDGWGIDGLPLLGWTQLF